MKVNKNVIGKLGMALSLAGSGIGIIKTYMDNQEEERRKKDLEARVKTLEENQKTE